MTYLKMTQFAPEAGNSRDSAELIPFNESFGVQVTFCDYSIYYQLLFIFHAGNKVRIF